MKIIGFSGKMGVGKTEAARHAVRCFGGTKIALGDAVKEECAEFLEQLGLPGCTPKLFGSQEDKNSIFEARYSANAFEPDLTKALYPYMQLHNGSFLVLKCSYRQLLQVWGTEYRRKQDRAYWVNVGREKAHNTEGLVYFDDIRFPDEVDMICEEGGMVCRINRPGIPTSSHESETALDSYDKFHWTILNNGSLTDYLSEIQRILRLVL